MVIKYDHMLIPVSIHLHLFGMIVLLIWLREANPIKKLFPFGHFPKVASTPPPVLDTLGVTFAQADLGKIIPPKTTSNQPKNSSKLPKKYPKTFGISLTSPPFFFKCPKESPKNLAKIFGFGLNPPPFLLKIFHK